MIVVPFYDLIIVPNVIYYFKKDYFEEIAGTLPEKGEQLLFLHTKADKSRENLTEDDIYPIGVVGEVQAVDNEENVQIHTTKRVTLDTIEINHNEIEVTYAERQDIIDVPESTQNEQYQGLKNAVLRFVGNFQWGMMASRYVRQWKNIDEMAASLSQYLELTNEEKYKILEADTISERHTLMEHAIFEMMEVTKVGKEAEDAQTKKNERLYREDAIKKQIELLQKELDDMHPEAMTDIRKFEQKIAESGMNETARKEAEKILNRIKQEGENSHEYGSMYDYLDFVTSLSWKKEEFHKIDLDEAEKILDREHYGLKKAKNRILQQIAVMSLNKKQSGSILLFLGAPGTGKTSIGQSIADALGRKYVRVSLGGIRDEAEIRGHRRTYVGAMPGRIMEGIKRSGVSNPVMVLDEVDKLMRGMEGDPSSALLEVLDPEQNNTFTDHYMNVPYDLSDVLFICTANNWESIPEPLLNRMEVIEFQGYTETEKMQIAKRHLLPKAMEKMGIRKGDLKISDKALHSVISDYTMEAGVRGLRKQMETLCRVAAVQLVKGEGKKVSIGAKNLPKYLDRKPIRHDQVKDQKNPGIVTGLAWTQAGGDILFIETMFTRGEGHVIITGQLGDVMKESASIAITLVKAMFPEKAELFAANDLHIHVPAGAVPKDGPSAGITLTTALVSLVTGIPVNPEYAMTGEVSLQGKVMPIGGLPEKLMAAVRAGVKKVFIPKENAEDLEEIPDEVKEKLEICPVTAITDVLAACKLVEKA